MHMLLGALGHAVPGYLVGVFLADSAHKGLLFAVAGLSLGAILPVLLKGFGAPLPKKAGRKNVTLIKDCLPPFLMLLLCTAFIYIVNTSELEAPTMMTVFFIQFSIYSCYARGQARLNNQDSIGKSKLG